jgi:hypothetical protein
VPVELPPQPFLTRSGALGYSIGSSARGANASRVKPTALMIFGSTTSLNLLELNRQVARPYCRAGCG